MFWFEHRYDQFEKSTRTVDSLGWIYDRIQSTICFFFGHSPEADQCGRPEHDFCLWCMKLTPNQAERKQT